MSISGQARFDPAAMLRAYAKEIRHWAMGVAARRAVALGTMLAAAISLVVALGIGVSALFHYIETTYGIYIAFAIVGGCFLLFGVVGMTIGLGSWNRPISSFPRPHLRSRLLKASFVLPAAARTLAGRANENRGVHKQILAAAAAGIFIAWIVASRRGRGSARARSRG
jgi:hypothetical protein